MRMKMKNMRRGDGPKSGPRGGRRLDMANMGEALAGKRRGKLFDGQELQLLLLSLIAETPRHGYDLIREVEARSNGAYTPSPGMVYPTLTLLVDQGYAAEANAEGSKKTFQITSEGEQLLGSKPAEITAINARIAQIAEKKGRVDAAPVQRAMRNLKSAVLNRLSAEGVDDETIFAVVALIDDAAGKIERA